MREGSTDRDENRSPWSVAELMSEEYEPMIRLAFVLTRDQQLAEDVVQDALIEVQGRWSSLLNPGGYLRRAVVNGAMRQQRRRQRGQELERQAWARPEATPGHEYLVDALARLPKRHRTAVVLAYYGRYTSAEIAEFLGCRPGTAKSLVHRGLARLRKELR